MTWMLSWDRWSGLSRNAVDRCERNMNRSKLSSKNGLRAVVRVDRGEDGWRNEMAGPLWLDGANLEKQMTCYARHKQRRIRTIRHGAITQAHCGGNPVRVGAGGGIGGRPQGGAVEKNVLMTLVCREMHVAPRQPWLDTPRSICPAAV